jgi:hypothetical protein
MKLYWGPGTPVRIMRVPGTVVATIQSVEIGRGRDDRGVVVDGPRVGVWLWEYPRFYFLDDLGAP